MSELQVMPESHAKMAVQDWTPRSAWHGVAAPGHIGPADAAGVLAELVDDVGMATLIASSHDARALADGVKAICGLVLPEQPHVVAGRDVRAVWAGPGQWLLLTEKAAAIAPLHQTLSGLAAFTDQSGSRALLRLGGPDLRRALAKGCMVDLHPSAFPVGAAALTSIAYMGVHLWRLADGPQGARFEITVARSMAASFWSWFTASAAEFGCTVTAGGRG